MKRFIFLLLFLLIIFFLIRYVENKSLFFPDKDLSMYANDFSPDCQDIYFKTDDGVVLNGWFFKNRRALKTMLFLHGNAGNVSHRLDKLLMFHDMGFNIFIVDYRGYGRSEGAASEQGLYRDARAAYDYLKSRNDVDMDKVVGYGESLGGAIIIDLAQDRKFSALIVDSTFSRISDMAKLVYPYLPSFLLFSKMDSLSKVGDMDFPKLFIHSRQDDIVPFELGQNLFEKASEPKEFLEIKGDHNEGFLKSRGVYTKGIKSFLKKQGLDS